MQGVEATLYAALMSISNAASGAGEVLGAGLTQLLGITAQEFGNMPWLVFLCTVSALFPIPFLRLIQD